MRAKGYIPNHCPDCIEMSGVPIENSAAQGRLSLRRPPGSGARHRRGFRGRSPSRRRFSSSVERSGPARACELAGPTQFRYGAVFLPQAVFENKYVIAYCAWEIERVPDQWLEGLELVDEIWVCSEFVSRTADKKNPQRAAKLIGKIEVERFSPETNRGTGIFRNGCALNITVSAGYSGNAWRV